MTSWRPQTREPDPLRAALYDYLRNRAAQVFVNGTSETCPLGRADMVMGNGGKLAVDLRVTPAEAKKQGTRDVIVFEVTGHAADTAQGYEVNGRIVLDRETKAFLAIDAMPTVLNTRY